MGKTTVVGSKDDNEFNIQTSSKAFEILSSQIYDDPIMAIVRELSCNAADSHIEAGKENVPFEIKFPTSLEPNFSVKDYGKGLSHEDIMNLYTTYFESTKSNDPDSTGMFGLGSKTPFAYTDVFTVTSRFNGKKRVYSAYYDEGGPNISLMHEKDTEENNGVEISIPIGNDDDLKKFKKKSEFVFKFFNTKPLIKGLNDDLNYNLNILDEGKGWSLAKDGSMKNGIFAVQSRVAYPLQLFSFNDDFSEYFSFSDLNLIKSLLDYYIILFHFDNGEIDVSPSRETINKSENNAVKIKEKLEIFMHEAHDELNEKVKNTFRDKFDFVEKTLGKNTPENKTRHGTNSFNNNFISSILENDDIDKFAFYDRISGSIPYISFGNGEGIELNKAFNSSKFLKDNFQIPDINIVRYRYDNKKPNNIEKAVTDISFVDILRYVSEAEQKTQIELIFRDIKSSHEKRIKNYINLNPNRKVYLINKNETNIISKSDITNDAWKLIDVFGLKRENIRDASELEHPKKPLPSSTAQKNGSQKEFYKLKFNKFSNEGRSPVIGNGDSPFSEDFWTKESKDISEINYYIFSNRLNENTLANLPNGKTLRKYQDSQRSLLRIHSQMMNFFNSFGYIEEINSNMKYLFDQDVFMVNSLEYKEFQNFQNPPKHLVEFFDEIVSKLVKSKSFNQLVLKTMINQGHFRFHDFLKNNKYFGNNTQKLEQTLNNIEIPRKINCVSSMLGQEVNENNFNFKDRIENLNFYQNCKKVGLNNELTSNFSRYQKPISFLEEVLVYYNTSKLNEDFKLINNLLENLAIQLDEFKDKLNYNKIDLIDFDPGFVNGFKKVNDINNKKDLLEIIIFAIESEENDLGS